jgi:hypothetical protein
MRIAVSAAALGVAALVITFAAGLAVGEAKARVPSGDAQSITVRGDWDVTIRNADGTVAQEHRFHNEFNGATTVGPILAHSSTTGRFWLTLSDSGGANPCGTDAPAACFNFEADDPNSTVAGWFGNLTPTSSTSGELVITSNMTATRNGQFNQVRMLLSRCAATTAPASCHPGAYGNFSLRTLASPIAVVAGQQILVTVTYTFSAAP